MTIFLSNLASSLIAYLIGYFILQNTYSIQDITYEETIIPYGCLHYLHCFLTFMLSFMDLYPAWWCLFCYPKRAKSSHTKCQVYFCLF